MNGGWMDGFADGYGQSPPPALPVVVKVSRITVTVICCPACRSVDVTRKGGRTPGHPMAWWECGCGERWKEPADVGEAGKVWRG